MKRLGRPAMLAALVAAWWWGFLAAAAAAEPDYRFRLPPGSTAVLPDRALLTAEERAFIASLPELRVGLNTPDNRPYEVINEQGEISGIQIEILTHVAQALGLKLRPVVLPSFPQALDALRERRVDLMATLGYEPSREAYLRYTLGTAPNPGAIIGRAADPRFAAEPTLNGRRVAIERAYVTQYYARRAYPEILVSDQPDTASALRAVALGEDDYYFGSLLMAMDRIQRDSVAGLEVKKALVYATGQMHFGVRSDWPLLASALSKGVAALRTEPLPQLQQALKAIDATGQAVPALLGLSTTEQRQLAGRSVLRVGAVRGLTLLNEASPGGGHTGIAADYTDQVAARLGVAVDIVPFDSTAEMLDALRAGRIHLVPWLSRSAARERDFVFSRPYLDMPYLLVARSDAPLYWGLESLRGLRLALTAQHPLRELLAERYPDIQVIEARSGAQALDLVAEGGADAAVEVKLFAHMRINSDARGRLRAVGPVEQLPAQFHFAGSREMAALMPLIDRALADIPAPERERLLRRWVAVDFTPPFPWRRYLPLALTLSAALLLMVLASLWWMRRLAGEVNERTLAEQRLRDVTASLPGVVFQYVVGPGGRIEQRFVSAGLDAFFGPGISTEAGVVDAVIARMPPDDGARLRTARVAALATRSPLKASFRYQDPRHGERWLHCEATPSERPAGRTAWTGFVVDVSSERALQAQLIGALQAQNLFVASASHELRAPLQAITLALQRLGGSGLDAAQRALWRIASESSAALVQLIDDVLDLARMEARRLVLHPQPTDLHALLEQLAQAHRLAAESRGLALGLQMDADMPRYLSVDALRLRQLLVNLLSNAIKYTREGRVVLNAARRAGDRGERLVLSVTDTGIGIPPERQGALFEPFETLHQPQHAPAEGSTGLGLAICKRLVEAMDGSIRLDSAPGRGTRVEVDLPMPPLADAPPAAAPAPAAAGRVLLVDDDAVSRVLMADSLRAAGHAVAEAGCAAEAWPHWAEGGIAVVVSDRHLPDGDGLDLLRRFGAAAAAAARPVRLVLCSGSEPELDDRLEGLDAVLTKPVGTAALQAAVRGGTVPLLP